MREMMLLGPRDLRLRVAMPETRRERRRGLLGRVEIGADEAMLFPRARSVHTVGMRVEIAVAVLDADLAVREVIRMRPGRALWPRAGARHVLEFAPGVDLHPGDRLRLDAAATHGPAARRGGPADGRYTSRRYPRRPRAPIV